VTCEERHAAHQSAAASGARVGPRAGGGNTARRAAAPENRESPPCHTRHALRRRSPRLPSAARQAARAAARCSQRGALAAPSGPRSAVVLADSDLAHPLRPVCARHAGCQGRRPARRRGCCGKRARGAPPRRASRREPFPEAGGEPADYRERTAHSPSAAASQGVCRPRGRGAGHHGVACAGCRQLRCAHAPKASRAPKQKGGQRRRAPHACAAARRRRGPARAPRRLARARGA
jgi:hypothetical protein